MTQRTPEERVAVLCAAAMAIGVSQTASMTPKGLSTMVASLAAPEATVDEIFAAIELLEAFGLIVRSRPSASAEEVLTAAPALTAFVWRDRLEVKWEQWR